MSVTNSNFNTLWNSLPEAATSAFRQKAWRQFEETGLPSAKQSGWRGISSKPLQQFSQLSPQQAPSVEFQEKIKELQERYDVLAFYNGRVSVQPAGWQATEFEPATTLFEDGVEALQEALSLSACEWTLVKSEKPLALVFWQEGSNVWSPVLLRLKIPSNSQAQILEHWRVDDGSLSSVRAEIEVGENAHLEWARFQRSKPRGHHLSSFQFRVQAHGRLDLTAVEAGALWSRYRLHVELLGSGAEAFFQGASLSQDEQKTAQDVQVRHRAAHTMSRQLFKSLAKEQSHNIFAGKIIIDQDAQKVDSAMTHHNLLLSPRAHADTQPELEIYADDVKAAHGATIGQLETDKVFYLRSRGLSHTDAVHLLAEAFLNDVLMRVKSQTLRASLQKELQEVLVPFVERLEEVTAEEPSR